MKRTQKLWVAISLLSLLFLVCGSSLVWADQLSEVQKRGKLIVGTSADYPPYESVDDKGAFVGFDMDLVREVAKRIGVEVEIKDMAFDSLIAALQQKKIDAVIAAMQGTPEREKKVDFSIIYHDIKDALLVKGDSDITLKSASDMAGHKVAVQTGTIQEKWARENLVKPGKVKEEDLLVYERVDNAAMDLSAGRVDILFIISDPAKKLAEKMGLKIGLVTGETVGAGQCIAVPEGEKALKAEIDKAIEAMKADGKLKELMDKWDLV